MSEKVIKSLITDEHIKEFNTVLEHEGSVIRLVWDSRSTIDIKLLPDENLDSFIVNPSKKFYSKLNVFFNSKDIYDLSFNNTGTSFWKFG